MNGAATRPAATQRPRIVGVLLAAGSGRRFGGPKALADTGDGPWVVRAWETLRCLDDQLVVVGAAATEVTDLLPPGVRTVYNPDHRSGMGSSLVAAIRALASEEYESTAQSSGDGPAIHPISRPVDAAVMMLVDLPDVPAAAIQRVVDAVATHGTATAHMRRALARATYDGRPGHPVLIGADHFAGVLAAAGEDRGARDYLATHSVATVECGDLATGVDIDEAPPT